MHFVPRAPAGCTDRRLISTISGSGLDFMSWDGRRKGRSVLAKQTASLSKRDEVFVCYFPLLIWTRIADSDLGKNGVHSV